MSGWNEFKIFMRFLLPSNAGINVAEEPFHRRFTVVEGFGSESALIEIHLSSIYLLVSVTVNSVKKNQQFYNGLFAWKNFYKWSKFIAE